MAWPLALVKLVTVGLYRRALRCPPPPTPTPDRAPSLWVLDTLLAAPLFVETKQRASGGWFSAPKGEKVAGSGAGLSVWLCFVWGLGSLQQNNFKYAEGL